MFIKAKGSEIINWVRNGQLNELGGYLVSGSVHGKPGVPAAELARIEKIVFKALAADEVFKLGESLLARPEYTSRNLGTVFIRAGWPMHKKEVEQLLLKASNDEDWIVREFAAESVAWFLQKDFIHFSKLFKSWVKSESVNVKRAIALAVKYDSKSQDKGRWKTYVSLVEPLLREEADYIRKNLGPFAIGDGLLVRFPSETLSACQKWVSSKNENVRRNTAMVFTSAAARKFKKEGSAIIEKLIVDEVPAVKSAAKKAKQNLARA